MMKKFENPLRFDKVMVVSLVAYFFLAHPVYQFTAELLSLPVSVNKRPPLDRRRWTCLRPCPRGWASVRLTMLTKSVFPANDVPFVKQSCCVGWSA